MDTPPLPRRKTIRLQNYDYSQAGAYFVTICTAHKRPLFGVVRRGDPFRSPACAGLCGIVGNWSYRGILFDRNSFSLS